MAGRRRSAHGDDDVKDKKKKPAKKLRKKPAKKSTKAEKQRQEHLKIFQEKAKAAKQLLVPFVASDLPKVKQKETLDEEEHERLEMLIREELSHIRPAPDAREELEKILKSSSLDRLRKVWKELEPKHLERRVRMFREANARLPDYEYMRHMSQFPFATRLLKYPPKRGSPNLKELIERQYDLRTKQKAELALRTKNKKSDKSDSDSESDSSSFSSLVEVPRPDNVLELPDSDLSEEEEPKDITSSTPTTNEFDYVSSREKNAKPLITTRKKQKILSRLHPTLTAIARKKAHENLSLSQGIDID